MIYFNLFLTVFITLFHIAYTIINRKHLSSTAGMMIAMSIGMMFSLTLGLLVGILYQPNMNPSIGISILFGMLAGYLTGKPFSLIASLDGMIAGIMGGMMGAMLGAMLVDSKFMMWFVLIIFLLVMLVLFQMINEEISKKKENDVKDTIINSFGRAGLFIMSFIIFGSLFSLLVIYVFIIDENKTHTYHNNSTVIQDTSISVTSAGYFPETLVLKPGPAIINFRMDSSAICARQVISKDLGINRILDEGDNYITVTDLKEGTYHYQCDLCGMDTFSGVIIVR